MFLLLIEYLQSLKRAFSQTVRVLDSSWAYNSDSLKGQSQALKVKGELYCDYDAQYFKVENMALTAGGQHVVPNWNTFKDYKYSK